MTPLVLISIDSNGGPENQTSSVGLGSTGRTLIGGSASSYVLLTGDALLLGLDSSIPLQSIRPSD